ncbi:hypothetical protein ABZV93_03705 [Actinopolymorpha sp. NPDC004070]|uniref:hypothetical protein n=1 Tax=Actinopolymorpha sp. NPDC004070 TaxID=3154548 RepID=UPI0033ADA4A9
MQPKFGSPGRVLRAYFVAMTSSSRRPPANSPTNASAVRRTNSIAYAFGQAWVAG